MRINLSFSLCLSLLLSASCQKAENQAPVTLEREITDKEFSEIFVPQHRLALFASVKGNILDRPLTRAASEEVSLESLLDTTNIQTVTAQNLVYEQIPFRLDSVGHKASFSLSLDYSSELATIIKKYLIRLSEPGTGFTDLYVATLITEKSYSEAFPEFSFIDRPNYTGVVLFSDLYGNLLETHLYRNGLILSGLPTEEGETYLPENLCYVTVFENIPTKDGDNEILDPSVCIAYVGWINPAWCYGSSPGGGGSGSNPGVGGGSGSGGGHYQIHDDRNNDGPDIRPMELKYRIRVSTNCPDDIRMSLNEIGSYPGQSGGSQTVQVSASINPETCQDFVKGSYVAVAPSYVRSDGVSRLKDFSYWTGTFSDRKTDSFMVQVNADMVSTAYYEQTRPCTDSTRMITNPLINMKIASSNTWGNYKGGTFGMTRKDEDGNPKRHQGIDLLATEGTPIFAMYSGVILSVFSDCPNIPDSGSSNGGFGNELRIKTTLDNGSSFIVQYAHLNYGTPIAINPRTGSPYAINDVVYQGDLIGYTGRTGNAYNVPYKHLHLGVKLNGRWVNPADYINGSIDVNTINTTRGRINDIICD